MLTGKMDVGAERVFHPDDQLNVYPDLPNTLDHAISVLICARNEALNLKRHLPSVLEQRYSGYFEVLVLDDASTDDTSNVLNQFQAIYPHLKVLRMAEKTSPGKKQALARGIEAAKFDNLVFTDADCRPSSRFWLANLVKALSERPETEIVLGYGPFRPKSGFLNAWARYETAYTALQYVSFARSGIPYMGVGRNLALKKQLYKRVGGFQAHRDLPSGDDDLLVNAGAQAGKVVVCLEKQAFMYSEAKTTWRAWLRQKSRHLSAGTLYRRQHLVLLGLVGLTQVAHYSLLIMLLASGYGIGFVLLGYGIRLIALRLTLAKTLPALGESGLLTRFPVFDALLTLYYVGTIPLAFLGKRSKNDWK